MKKLESLDMSHYWQSHGIQPVDSFVAIAADLRSAAMNLPHHRVHILTGDKFTIDEAHQYASDIRMHLPGQQILSVLAYDTYLAEAQQVLLKVLEESPDHVHILILTLDGAAILPTVQSRCRIYPPMVKKGKKAPFAMPYPAISTDLATRFVHILSASGNLPKTWIADAQKWFKVK